jgi:hypothetical protein
MQQICAPAHGRCASITVSRISLANGRQCTAKCCCQQLFILLLLLLLLLCRSATTKMWLANPLSVHTLLLNLLRLKQAQLRAAKAAAKWQQQQQQQQELGAAEERQEGVTQSDAQAATDTTTAAAVQSSTTPQTPQQQQLPPPPAAAGGPKSDSQSGMGSSHPAPPSPTSSLTVQTLAELQFLRAAVQWLQAHPQAFQRSQTAGIIMTVAELLPDAPPAAAQAGAGAAQPAAAAAAQPGAAPDLQAQALAVPEPAEEPSQQQEQDQQQRQQQQQQKADKKAAAKLAAVRSDVLLSLQQLVPVWRQDVGVLGQSMGKGRPARFFKLKWAQLLQKCGCDA